MSENSISQKTAEPEFMIEIFLQPGEYYWGDSDTRIRTLLGSCVAICLWHPRKKIGGMCHIQLPGWADDPCAEKHTPAKYAEEAFLLFLRDIGKSGTRHQDYVAKVFGGGYLLEDEEKMHGIGKRNVKEVHRILHEYRIKVVSEDTGENVHRKLFFDLWSGEVWLKKTYYNK